MARLVILGGGGHASDVLSVIESLELSSPAQPVAVVDEGDPNIERFAGRHIVMANSLQAATDVVGHDARFVSGIGYPVPRRRLVEAALAHGLKPVDALVHQTAVLNANVTVNTGAVVMGHTWVSPSVQLQAHTYVGYGAKLGHDCVIAEYTSLLPGCFVGGNVTVGRGSLIGANATVLPGVSIGDGSQVGAGAVVTKDVKAGSTVLGIPAVKSPATRACGRP